MGGDGGALGGIPPPCHRGYCRQTSHSPQHFTSSSLSSLTDGQTKPVPCPGTSGPSDSPCACIALALCPFPAFLQWCLPGHPTDLSLLCSLAGQRLCPIRFCVVTAQCCSRHPAKYEIDVRQRRCTCKMNQKLSGNLPKFFLKSISESIRSTLIWNRDYKIWSFVLYVL